MGAVDLDLELCRLVHYGIQKGLVQEEDRAYTLNRLLALLGRNSLKEHHVSETLRFPAEILENLCGWAAETGLLSEDSTDARDRFDTELMACLTPRPSEVIRRFYSLYAQDKKAATDYYYDLSRASNYIRVDRIEKDRMWTTPTKYGDLVITINLSKPEKDPKAIAAAKNAPQSGYPKCALCRENEGFRGSANQAPRGNHRLIPLSLCGETWFLQYSPYVYYNEHCIVLSKEHQPMKVSRASFEHLLGFVELFPHYFVGSNADLPIVGGSILSHDHFQGGCYEFPMAKAGIREPLSFRGFDEVEAGVVDWPMSVLRLRSGNKEMLVELADKILEKWRGYSDESADILAFTEPTQAGRDGRSAPSLRKSGTQPVSTRDGHPDGNRGSGALCPSAEGVPHNTITPIARRREGKFELDLVLRNNRTTAEHPLGLFHPHAEYHHVKKENIGLIEVMGLAILPPRLLVETKLLEEALQNPERAAEILARPEMEKHAQWYRELKAAVAADAVDATGVSGEAAESAIQNSIGGIFMEILANAGVYKDTPEGRAAFRRFCESV